MSDPAIAEILVGLDQQLGDLERTCDAIERYVEEHRTRDQGTLKGELDGFERSARSELCCLVRFVENLETEETRGRIVTSEESAS